MRRGVQTKKKKNGATILIAVGLNVIVWGGLALLFTIHKIAQERSFDVTMVAMKQAAFKPIKQPPAKKIKAKTKPQPKASKGGKAHKASGPPHPHFMASAPSSSGGSGGQTVAAGGSGKAGQLFTNKPPVTKQQQPKPVETPSIPPKTIPKKKAIPETKPLDKAPKIVFHQAPSGRTREASPVAPLLPKIPTSLRSETFAASMVVQVSLDEQGNSTVSLLSSSGNAQLDKLVMSAIQKWKWNPATVDGVPIPALFNYKVELNVN